MLSSFIKGVESRRETIQSSQLSFVKQTLFYEIICKNIHKPPTSKDKTGTLSLARAAATCDASTCPIDALVARSALSAKPSQEGV